MSKGFVCCDHTLDQAENDVGRGTPIGLGERTGRDTAGDLPGVGAEQSTAPSPEPLELGILHFGEELERAQVVRATAEVGHVGSDEEPKSQVRLIFFQVVPAHPLESGAQCAVQELAENVVLAREVVEQGRLPESDFGGDDAGRGGGVPICLEQPSCRAEDHPRTSTGTSWGTARGRPTGLGTVSALLRIGTC